MSTQTKNHPHIVKSPLLSIPLGEPIQNDDGRLGLRMKKPGEQKYEDVWLDEMMGTVAKEVTAGSR